MGQKWSLGCGPPSTKQDLVLSVNLRILASAHLPAGALSHLRNAQRTQDSVILMGNKPLDPSPRALYSHCKTVSQEGGCSLTGISRPHTTYWCLPSGLSKVTRKPSSSNSIPCSPLPHPVTRTSVPLICLLPAAHPHSSVSRPQDSAYPAVVTGSSFSVPSARPYLSAFP